MNDSFKYLQTEVQVRGEQDETKRTLGEERKTAYAPEPLGESHHSPRRNPYLHRARLRTNRVSSDSIPHHRTRCEVAR